MPDSQVQQAPNRTAWAANSSQQEGKELQVMPAGQQGLAIQRLM
jgi:hypothetical protein